MKALLLKDCYVLRKQVWSYAIIVLVWGVVPQAWLNLLAVVYGSIIPYSAMAYDQRSRWDKFTRMLPYSDQAAVMSRYVLGWIFILVGAAIVMLSQGILSQLSIPSAFFSCSLSVTLFAALCIGTPRCWHLNIPLMLRLGAEKARLVSALTTFLVFASAGALSGLADAESTAPVMLALPVLAVLAIIATAVSIPLSLKIYRENR
ncbi:MAG: ABC-2 transporter permease [Dysosmobacter sp.]